MGLFDVLMGRTKQAPADLDHLFALPSAAVTLEADLDVRSNCAAAVCFKPGTGASFAAVEERLAEILNVDAQSDATTPTNPSQADAEPTLRWYRKDDQYGYQWVVLRSQGLEQVVTNAHMVNASLEDSGFGPALLCSAFSFLALPQSTTKDPLHLIYLYKRGTFYPFAPNGNQSRNNELELRVRASVGVELHLEPDLSRWFPLWGLPLP